MVVDEDMMEFEDDVELDEEDVVDDGNDDDGNALRALVDMDDVAALERGEGLIETPLPSRLEKSTDR